jgi:hypothetical protein
MENFLLWNIRLQGMTFRHGRQKAANLTCQFVIMGISHTIQRVRDESVQGWPKSGLKVEMVAFLRVSEGWRQAMFGIR